jgi:hypothetical protein
MLSPSVAALIFFMLPPASATLELRTALGAVKIEPWGTNALRVRAVVAGGGAVRDGLPGALITPGSDNKGAPLAAPLVPPIVDWQERTITNGNIAATVGSDGLVSVSRVSDGVLVLQELAREVLRPGGAPPPPPPPAPPAPPVPSHTMTIAVNNSAARCCGGRHGGCCLDVANWDRADNAPVKASSCNYDPHGFGGKGFLNQRWTLGADGTIRVALDAKCLTAASAASVTVAACQPGEAKQKWRAATGVGPIRTMSGGGGGSSSGSGGSDQCLTLDNKADCGAGYSLAPCDPTNKKQEWTIETAIPPPAPPPPPPPPPQPSLTLLSFAAKPDDKVFGFGEHQQGNLDNKGMTYDMESCLVYGKSHGGEVCLPWVLSASSDGRGGFALEYGMLWNMPNYGGVSFGVDSTNWTATDAYQVDYFVAVAGVNSSSSTEVDPVSAGGITAGEQIMHSYRLLRDIILATGILKWLRFEMAGILKWLES